MGKPIWNFHKPSRASNELSAREREVLTLTAQGCAVSEIAAHLSLSTKTVEHHRANIRRKTGRQRTAQLTMLAIKMGLVELT